VQRRAAVRSCLDPALSRLVRGRAGFHLAAWFRAPCLLRFQARSSQFLSGIELRSVRSFGSSHLAIACGRCPQRLDTHDCPVGVDHNALVTQ
jgi:hypothetical protein